MNGIKTQIKQTAKQAAIKAAKRTVLEPIEIARTAHKQVLPVPEVGKSAEKQSESKSSHSEENTNSEDAEVKKEKSKRLIQAYEAEIEDIRESKKQQEFQEEQAQEVEEERKKEEEEEKNTLIEPATKPKRGLFAGLKTRLKRLQSRGEIRMPPSG